MKSQSCGPYRHIYIMHVYAFSSQDIALISTIKIHTSIFTPFTLLTPYFLLQDEMAGVATGKHMWET